MKKGSFVKIVKPDSQWNGKSGSVVGRTKDGKYLIVSIDLDGDPATPPIEVKIEAKYARAFRIINWFVSILLPLFYGIRRK